MKLIVLGSPGVGKGTYTQELVTELKVPHISSGDIFRENIRSKTELGKKVENYIASGKLVPDQLTIAIIKERLSKKDCSKGFILDGFPRTIPQAGALEKVTPVDLVINFKADREVIIGRLSGRITCKSCNWIYHLKNVPPKVENKCDKCGGKLFHRPDDEPEAIARRLDIYEKETAPLITYYANKKLLAEIIINEEFGKFKNVIMNRIMGAIKKSL